MANEIWCKDEPWLASLEGKIAKMGEERLI